MLTPARIGVHRHLFGIRSFRDAKHLRDSIRETQKSGSVLCTAPCGAMAAPPGSWVGAIDQGTTSTRFFLYDEKLNVVGAHQMEFTQIHPQAGYAILPCHKQPLPYAVCITHALASDTPATPSSVKHIWGRVRPFLRMDRRG